MTGTFINMGTIVLGSTLGLVLRHHLSTRFSTIVFQALGLFNLFLGVSMALDSKKIIFLIVSLTIGGFLGEWLRLEERVDALGSKLKSGSSTHHSRFSDGLITAFLLFCMGSMSVVGALEDGLKGHSDVLFTKSVMDGISSLFLSAAFGYGVIFSIIPLLIYQGGISLMASFFAPFFTQPLINELSAVGGIMIIGIGINILEIKKIRVLNLFPALVVVVILMFIFP